MAYWLCEKFSIRLVYRKINIYICIYTITFNYKFIIRSIYFSWYKINTHTFKNCTSMVLRTCWTGGKPSTWFPPEGLVESMADCTYLCDSDVIDHRNYKIRKSAEILKFEIVMTNRAWEHPGIIFSIIWKHREHLECVSK